MPFVQPLSPSAETVMRACLTAPSCTKSELQLKTGLSANALVGATAELLDRQYLERTRTGFRLKPGAAEQFRVTAIAQPRIQDYWETAS